MNQPSPKKARGDAKLKTLPAPVQAELFEQCKPGYAQARDWLLAEHGVKTSTGALSNFYGWYPFSLSATANYVQQFEPELKRITETAGEAEKLSQLSQFGFELMAMRAQDLEGYATLKKIRLKEREIALNQEALKLKVRQYEQKIEAARTSLEKAKGKGGVSPETLKLIEEQLKLL
jgi:hypothetical protein